MTQQTIPDAQETMWTPQEWLTDIICRRVISEETYLALSDAMNFPLELSEGRLVVREMPTPLHQHVVSRLWLVIHNWAEEHHAGRAYFAPMPVRLWPRKFREPDVMFFKTENLNRVTEK